MIIAIDFDGTCVYHDFPNIGKDIGAVPILKELVKEGHKLILYTMRSHPDSTNGNKDSKGNLLQRDTLQEAIDWFKDRNIPLYGINENPTQKNWTSSPKVYANYYIDDAALGIPMKLDVDGKLERPYVNWERLKVLLQMRGLLKVNKDE